MEYKSLAKLNLYLDILSRREDGYHDLEMVMVPIALFDKVEISLHSGPKDIIECDGFTADNIKTNSAYKALQAMRKKFGFSETFKVKIEKHIPSGAGLGGGSSNAASVINAINELLNLNASDEALNEVAKLIGADVPFFLKSQPALVKGIGEHLSPITVKDNYDVLLIKPAVSLSTAHIYKLSDTLPMIHGNIDDVLDALANGNLNLLGSSMFNSLEAPAFSEAPVIKEIKDKLYELGFKALLMSGSGSTVYALTNDQELLNNGVEAFKHSNHWVYVTTFNEQ